MFMSPDHNTVFTKAGGYRMNFMPARDPKWPRMKAHVFNVVFDSMEHILGGEEQIEAFKKLGFTSFEDKDKTFNMYQKIYDAEPDDGRELYEMMKGAFGQLGVEVPPIEVELGYTPTSMRSDWINL